MLAVRALASTRRALHAGAVRLANDRFFTKKHEWIAMNGDVGTVGITDFATGQLGDVVFVELPSVGATLSAGDSAGAVESVKAASDIYSPATGTVTETNETLESDPGLLNKSPFKDGWIYKLKLKNADELKSLMTSTAYDEFKKNEEAAH